MVLDVASMEAVLRSGASTCPDGGRALIGSTFDARLVERKPGTSVP